MKTIPGLYIFQSATKKRKYRYYGQYSAKSNFNQSAFSCTHPRKIKHGGLCLLSLKEVTAMSNEK